MQFHFYKYTVKNVIIVFTAGVLHFYVLKVNKILLLWTLV